MNPFRIRLQSQNVKSHIDEAVTPNSTPGNNIAYFIHLAGLNTPENDQDLINIAKFTSRKIGHALIAVGSEVEEEGVSERPRGAAKVFFNDSLVQQNEIVNVK